MRKIALLLSVAATMVVAFGIVPAAEAAPKNRRTGGDDNNISSTDDSATNDVGNGGNEAGFAGAAVVAVTEPTKTKPPSSKLHNAKLLNRLGMKRVRTGGANGANHHRKRLASQSRSKYGADGKGGSDSQMFIVKLPPHSHFYDDGAPVAVHQKPQHQHHQHHQSAPYKSLNTVPVGFVSNGKPAKVYHWNLPVIKHALHGGRYKGGKDGVVAVHHLGQYNHLQPAGELDMPRRTLYYKPRSAGKPMKKSFVNNGKPNGFYVVSNKNAAAVPQYHKIVKAYYGSGDD